jgi:DNA modification methylase
MIENRILTGNSLDILKTLPEQSVDCCVTSPPYFNLRNYGNIPGQIGIEEHPDAYIKRLIEIFREVKRILKDDGTLWVNIGDTYNGSGKNNGNTKPISSKQKSNTASHYLKPLNLKYIPQQSLIGIPWRFAFAMMEEGWILRQDIIWAKPSPMPESVRDRFCKSHEYIFMFVKQKNYFFNINGALEPAVTPIRIIRNTGYVTKKGDTGLTPQHLYHGGRPFAKKNNQDRNDTGNMYIDTGYRLKRDVWTVATTPSTDEHYAMYPEKLIFHCILCGCRDNGIVLDPFMGSGTTAVVAMKLLRKYIGVEINPEYIKIAERRIANERGLFDE